MVKESKEERRVRLDKEQDYLTKLAELGRIKTPTMKVTVSSVTVDLDELLKVMGVKDLNQQTPADMTWAQFIGTVFHCLRNASFQLTITDFLPDLEIEVKPPEVVIPPEVQDDIRRQCDPDNP